MHLGLADHGVQLTVLPTGRVARAGRSGTAYSLVAPDELPYLLDLHLFLGRALTLACPQDAPAGERARLDLVQSGPSTGARLPLHTHTGGGCYSFFCF